MGGLELWRAVPKGARELLPGGRCPLCGSTRVHRSHAHGTLERLLKVATPLRPFACSVCRWRGLRVPVQAQGSVVELPPLPPRRPRRRHRPVSDTTRGAITARAFAKAAERRRRMQFVVVALLAAASGGMLIYCQNGELPFLAGP